MALEGKRILSQRTCKICVRQFWSDQARPYLLILYDHYRRGSRDDRITAKCFGILFMIYNILRIMLHAWALQLILIGIMEKVNQQPCLCLVNLF